MKTYKHILASIIITLLFLSVYDAAGYNNAEKRDSVAWQEDSIYIKRGKWISIGTSDAPQSEKEYTYDHDNAQRRNVRDQAIDVFKEQDGQEFIRKLLSSYGINFAAVSIIVSDNGEICAISIFTNKQYKSVIDSTPDSGLIDIFKQIRTEFIFPKWDGNYKYEAFHIPITSNTESRDVLLTPTESNNHESDVLIYRSESKIEVLYNNDSLTSASDYIKYIIAKEGIQGKKIKKTAIEEFDEVNGLELINDLFMQYNIKFGTIDFIFSNSGSLTAIRILIPNKEKEALAALSDSELLSIFSYLSTTLKFPQWEGEPNYEFFFCRI